MNWTTWIDRRFLGVLLWFQLLNSASAQLCGAPSKNLSAQESGISAIVQDVEGHVIIHAIWKGGPAHRAGVQPGARVVRVDDRDTTGLVATEVATIIRGRPGSIVRVVLVVRNDGEMKKFEIRREPIITTRPLLYE